MFRRARVRGSYDNIVRRRERGKDDGTILCGMCKKKRPRFLTLRDSKGRILCVDCWRSHYNEDGSKKEQCREDV